MRQFWQKFCKGEEKFALAEIYVIFSAVQTDKL
jgi:hypothetical protein